ncbi:uncharacterized protein LOC113862289 [Abrus precatorius]|uniref:Uncharacterized protein LOC113862289 n=1 Tax=Abrus precatorius TaxID=3816 RepID=A0A8B8L728_ABRPR|nr:uncharacterized protein LOC113862289 [Abrus precatorius]
MVPFKALYSRRCQTPVCWFQDGVHLMVGPEMFQRTIEQVELIQRRQSNSELLEIICRSMLEAFEILHHRGLVAYELALPPQLKRLHNGFHMSQLRKYVPDPFHVIKPDVVQLRDNLSVEPLATCIEDTRVKELRGKSI